MQDRGGALLVMAAVHDLFPWQRDLFADSAYAGDKLLNALTKFVGFWGHGFWGHDTELRSVVPFSGSNGIAPVRRAVPVISYCVRLIFGISYCVPLIFAPNFRCPPNFRTLQRSSSMAAELAVGWSTAAGRPVSLSQTFGLAPRATDRSWRRIARSVTQTLPKASRVARRIRYRSRPLRPPP
jgi:hypothetical protein